MRLKLMHVVDKCIIELTDKQALSSSAGSHRFQCVAVCLRGNTDLLYTHNTSVMLSNGENTTAVTDLIICVLGCVQE